MTATGFPEQPHFDGPAVSAAEVLERAAHIIHAVGWCQRSDFGRMGRLEPDGAPLVEGCCAISALDWAFFGQSDWPVWQPSGPPRFVGVGALESLLRGKLDRSLVSWNDDPERTAEDVIRLFEETAAELRRDHGGNVPWR